MPDFSKEQIEAALAQRDAWKERIGAENYAKFTDFIGHLGEAVELFAEIGDKLEFNAEETEQIEQACGLFEKALHTHATRCSGFNDEMVTEIQQKEDVDAMRLYISKALGGLKYDFQ